MIKGILQHIYSGQQFGILWDTWVKHKMDSSRHSPYQQMMPGVHLYTVHLMLD